MTTDQKQMLDQIWARWHGDRQVASKEIGQAIFDIGFLVGLVARLEEERRELLAKLRDEIAPE